MPVLALVKARDRGFTVDEDNLARQLKHTADHLNRGLENYKNGKGQGGQILTAGYALWTLDAGGQKGNETTAAVANYVLEYQKDADHWQHRGHRPPSSGSDFTATFVAVYGLAAFGTEEQQPKIKARLQTIQKWLQTQTPQETEDRVFRLRTLAYVDADEATVGKAVTELINSQHEDGGWAQKSDMSSDVYATATVLVALRKMATPNSVIRPCSMASSTCWQHSVRTGHGTWRPMPKDSKSTLKAASPTARISSFPPLPVVGPRWHSR